MALGTLAMAVVTSPAAFSADVVRIADHCAIYGPSLVDLGNGTCGQVSRGRIGDAHRWDGGTASAGLRSDGLGMLPGAGNARHLHVTADPDFR